MTNSRKAFEKWWQTVSKGKSNPPRYKEGYLHDNPNLAWVAWQAALEQQSKGSDNE